MQVAEQIMEEPVFDILRTKEQLGYSVYASIRNTYGTLGFVVYVNSQVNLLGLTSFHFKSDSILLAAEYKPLGYY